MVHVRDTHVPLIILLLHTIISGSLACKFSSGPYPPWFTMEQTFDMAPAVILGTHQGQSRDADSYRTNDTIEVHCIFKSGGFKFQQYIYLEDVRVTSCDVTNLVEGKRFLIAIKETKTPDETDDDYAVYTPDIAHTAAFEATEDNIQIVLRMCSLDNVITDPDGTLNKYMCPTRQVTGNNCTQPAAFPPSTVSPSMSNMIQCSHFLIFWILGFFIVV